MALLNILREPRREITESLVGIGLFVVVFGLVLPVDYQFALWFERDRLKPNIALAMLAGLAFMIMAFTVAAAVIFATHAIGEAVCNALERRGIRLRPARRPCR